MCILRAVGKIGNSRAFVAPASRAGTVCFRVCSQVCSSACWVMLLHAFGACMRCWCVHAHALLHATLCFVVEPTLTFPCLRCPVTASRSALPQPSDSDWDKPKPRHPIVGPASYPKSQPDVISAPGLFRKMDPEALFFAFYYQPDTYQQYLAAQVCASDLRGHTTVPGTTWHQGCLPTSLYSLSCVHGSAWMFTAVHRAHASKEYCSTGAAWSVQQ